MNYDYPDFETYRSLYQRFYDGRSSKVLLELAGDLTGKRVLDLCGGDGRLALAALQLGAQEVALVERQEKMIPPEVKQNPGIKIYLGSAGRWLGEFVDKVDQKITFDCIACQQAVNYWLNQVFAELVAKALTTKGSFIFNTFNQKPTVEPQVKQYVIGDHAFVEVSWLVGDWVEHIQVRSGMKPHYTSFRWLSPEYLTQILQPYFDVTVKTEGSTSLYRCVKK